MEIFDDDQELLSRMRLDDHVAFEIIFNRYVRQLYAYVSNKVISPNAQQKILERVFVSLWNDRSSIGDRVLKDHLYTLTRYELIRHIRQSDNFDEYLKSFKGFNQDE